MIYRRWPSKGALIMDCFLDAFGPVPLEGASRAELMSSVIRWIAAKIGELGVGDAFAGVFSDAVSDPALREVLSARLQDRYRLALQDALGEPMVDADVDALVEMVLLHFADGASPTRGGVQRHDSQPKRLHKTRGTSMSLPNPMRFTLIVAHDEPFTSVRQIRPTGDLGTRARSSPRAGPTRPDPANGALCRASQRRV
jgi:hypothetical protein